ncbi:MAG: hypothetical protein Q9161_004722 [Pseudevernia consocians]
MDLPPELRQIVYEELLCPHEDRRQHRRYARIRDYGLEPAIIRTCKQVYEEGLRVLYAKNNTFFLQMDKYAHQNLRGSQFPESPTGLPVAKVDCGKFGGGSVVTMDVSRFDLNLPKARKVGRPKKSKMGNKLPERQFGFIGFLSALPKFCRLLASCSQVGNLQLEIAAFMTTEQDMIKEAPRIADAYESRVSNQMNQKRWDDARETLLNALDFFDLLRTKYRLIPSIAGGTRVCPLEAKLIDMQWKHIHCCLEVRRTGNVHYLIRHMFSVYSSTHITPARKEGYWDRLADAHCAIGKAYVMDGYSNPALYSFFQALVVTPGHAETDKAIDDLEEMVKSSSKPDDVMARLNIEDVLKEVRHQESGRCGMTEDGEEEICSRFRATNREFKGLSRESRHTGFVISIMEPSFSWPVPGDDDYDSNDEFY